MSKSSERYSDIIDLPHHQSVRRPHMSVYNRAAQFAPFAALVGYDQMVQDTADILLLDQRVILNEDQKGILDEKIRVLQKYLAETPEIKVIYFDESLSQFGGIYVEYIGQIKRVFQYPSKIIFLDGKEIMIEDIIDIKSRFDNCSL